MNFFRQILIILLFNVIQPFAFGELACRQLFIEDQNLNQNIEIDQVRNLRPLKSVDGSAVILTGHFGSDDVVVKYRTSNVYLEFDPVFHKERVQAYEKEFENEANWYKWLNAHNIGVKYFGMSAVDGQKGIVIGRVKEKHVLLKEPNDDATVEDYRHQFERQKIKITAATIKELDRVINLFIKNNVMPFDLQFLITQTGQLILIDPEGFRLHQPNDYFTSKQLNEKLRKNFKRILQKLREN